MTIKPIHFWLRDEVKPGEKRTPILPEHAARLIAAGHKISVESSKTRCASNEEYEKVGCEIVPSGSWKTAPAFSIILGLKELDIESSASYPLVHRHIYFGHAYKNQNGWRQLLSRFVEGKGTLLDLEFLTHENGARVAAFGRSAGFVGMGVGLLNWIFQQEQKLGLHSKDSLLPSLRYYLDFNDLVQEVRTKLQNLAKLSPNTFQNPKILVIGALGRCGRGAVSLAEQSGLNPVKWDMEETKRGGPFPEIVSDYDVLVNCILLPVSVAEKTPPFLTQDLLQASSRKLATVVDVSCDYTNPRNPLPFYSDGTTFINPSLRILPAKNENELSLDVVAIDHLPSLTPLDSSREFADALLEHLIQCDDSEIWSRNRQLYEEKISPLVASPSLTASL